ncbi:MAG TPA: hypothetical protein VKS81_05415, partial [Bacteroidota bacterium]|nr:hypothetical protein [Bacteroidota bacterium]
ADAITEFYTMFREHRLPVPDEDIVQKYDRKFLTEELSKILGFQIDLMASSKNESLAVDSAQ